MPPVLLCLSVPLIAIWVIYTFDTIFNVLAQMKRLDHTSEEFGERQRHVTTLFATFLCSVTITTLFGAKFGTGNDPNLAQVMIVYLMPALALGYFAWVVPYVLYLTIDNEAFDADAVRLSRDTIVSIAFNISAASLLYKLHGLNPPDWDTSITPSDFLYFSAVTFSTLGYGDYAPLQSARPFAAFYAILGNLHLGIIVGAVLVALKGRHEEPTP